MFFVFVFVFVSKEESFKRGVLLGKGFISMEIEGKDFGRIKKKKGTKGVSREDLCLVRGHFHGAVKGKVSKGRGLKRE